MSEIDRTAGLARVPRSAWRPLPITEGERSRTWLPLLAFSPEDRWLGLDRAGDWLVVVKGISQIIAAGERESLPALTLLELGPDLFRRKLVSALNATGLSADWVGDFPVQRIVQCALVVRSQYWVHLAVPWIEFFGADDETKAALKRVSTEKWVAQSDRQRIRTLTGLSKRSPTGG